ncbi:MAG: Ig-like domain-containing protein [Solirubrobacterales bacterium]
MGRRSLAFLFAIVVVLAAAPAASAATLTVDDDGAQCPGAGYTKIQKAIDDAFNGDTIAVCAGTYVEGSGGVGSNALTISNKSIDIRGAGADLVAIQPKRSTPTSGQIADTNTSPALNIRNGVGDIVSIIGTKPNPVTVNISGVTIDGNGVYVEAGVVYRDGGGTLSRSRVTNIVTSESNTADTIPGGYRSAFPGIGVAQVTSGSGTPAVTRPPLNIDQTRINRYNTYGVFVDTATNDTPPLTASTVTNQVANITGSVIVGRTQCTAFNSPTPPPYVLGGPAATPSNQLPGNCSSVGLTTVGPTFGQDGVRVTSNSKVNVTDTTIAANLVHGTGAPTYNSATNNANLPLGAGVRLIGAGASTIQNSNLTDNAYGVNNVALDGTTANVAIPVLAENNYWGLRTNATSNTGPAISPTTNPPYQENPVNGTGVADPTCVTSTGAATNNSTAVDFCPFRNGNQADPNAGQWPVAYAPLPVSDAGPSVTLSSDSPTYDRGDTVTLTANASDDFGIAKVTFYDGNEVVGTAVPPNDEVTYQIPNDAPCAARSIRAVAKDSIGQTASDTKSITVVGPNNCEPPPDPPVEPTVQLTGVPATIDAEDGATVGADVTVDPTLTAKNVVFKLGNRTVCTDTTAPYSCEILPTGAEVGTQSIQAIVTDSIDQTAADSESTEVSKFETTLSIEHTGKTIKPRGNSAKKGKGFLVRKVTGEVSLHPRVTKAQGCSTGTVTLNVTRNKETLFPFVEVPLNQNCKYSLKFKVKKTQRHKFGVDASFSGNSVLLPASNKARFK